MRLLRDLSNIVKSGDSDWGFTLIVIGGFLFIMLVILIIKKLMDKI